MREDLIMPRWAQVGVEVSQIHYYSGARLGDSHSEGRRGKITRVLKTQVEVEFPLYRAEGKEKSTVLVKFKLKRGYKPFGEGNVRVDILEETGKKWSNDVLWPTEGKAVAYLRVRKAILQNSHKMQGVASEFAKKNAYHVVLSDAVKLMDDLQEASRERIKLEERILEIDEMPQDR